MNSGGQAHLGTPAPASVLGPVLRTSMTSMARTDAYAGVEELPIAAGWRPSGVPPRWRPVWEIAIAVRAGMDDACGQLATSKSNTKRGVCIGTRHDKCLSQQSPARTPSGEGRAGATVCGAFATSPCRYRSNQSRRNKPRSGPHAMPETPAAMPIPTDAMLVS